MPVGAKTVQLLSTVALMEDVGKPLLQLPGTFQVPEVSKVV